MDDRIDREHHDLALRRVCALGISAEGLRAIDRFVSRNLGPDFDSWRKPVLPSKCEISVARLYTGPLAIEVIIVLGAEGQVIQVPDSIIYKEESCIFLRGAKGLTRFTISLIRTRHGGQDEVGAARRIPDVGRANFCDV